MATLAITAGALGAAALAGGIKSLRNANKMKTDPRKVTYGGTQEKQDAMEGMYLGGVQQGNAQTAQGYTDLQKRQNAAARLGDKGALIMRGADNVQQVAVPNQGAAILGQYHPGEVAAAQAKQALDANTAASFGAARSGGALGLRNALNANATTGAQTAQGLAVQRAQEEQAYTQAQVAQANADQAQRFQADQQAAAQKAQLLGIGGQIAATSSGQAIQAANMQTQAGLEGQQQYLGQYQNLNNQQNTNDLEIEKIRQAEQSKKSDRKFKMGAGFINTAFGLGMKAAGGA
jgi:hypothetical protein